MARGKTLQTSSGNHLSRCSRAGRNGGASQLSVSVASPLPRLKDPGLALDVVLTEVPETSSTSVNIAVLLRFEIELVGRLPCASRQQGEKVQELEAMASQAG